MNTKQVNLPAIEYETTALSPEEDESLKSAVNEYQSGVSINWEDSE